MKVHLEDIGYSYLGNNIVSVTGQCAIYADDDTTLLHKKAVSTKQNLANNATDENGSPKWKTAAVNDIASQMVGIVKAYQAIMAAVKAPWPDAATPEDALSRFKAEVEGSVNGALGG